MKTSNNRLLIYFFYDDVGIIDNYILFLLKSIKKHTRRIVFISNVSIKKNNNELIKIADDVVIKENYGFDAYAYKYAFDYVGWNELREYDEIICCNSTFFGPIKSFDTMFEEMSKKENDNLDFWGITKHQGYSENVLNIPKYETNPYGFIPEHIQSYFVAFRKNLFMQEVFKDYWDNMPVIEDYFDAVCKFETVLTKYFSNAGFK